MKSSNEHVWCFLGDMSAETGAFHEAYKYSVNHDLPITFVVENNDKSVLTPTQDIWARKEPYYLGENVQDSSWFESKHLIHYRYNNSKYPHAGAGKRVQF
jgi:pyruvate dehydrogenase complex dehydrogenase (E1) component